MVTLYINVLGIADPHILLRHTVGKDAPVALVL